MVVILMWERCLRAQKKPRQGGGGRSTGFFRLQAVIAAAPAGARANVG
jgi:hypothetical protein